LKAHVLQDQQAYGHTEGQTQYIDEAKGAVLPNIPPGCDEVVF